MFTLLFFNTVKLYGGPKNHNPPPFVSENDVYRKWFIIVLVLILVNRN